MVATCSLCQLPIPAAIGPADTRCPRCAALAGATRLRAVRLTIRQSAQQTLACHARDQEEVETPRPPDPTIGRAAAGSVPDGVDYGPTEPPDQVPGYRIERVLGHGGMGSVYLATQLSLDRPVALKVMSRQWAADPVFIARFTREAFAAALLNHSNVVQVYDIGEVDGTRFFSMEYVAGRTLADVLRIEGKFDPETAVGYVLQAARGLQHAHDRGMIHRDVKPDNLLLDEQGVVKVADLGLVKTPFSGAEMDQPTHGLRSLPPNMTGVKMALGTPTYMAPEQCRDAASVDHRADVYGLGATLYTLVTGRPPFDGVTDVELMTKQAYAPLIPPEEHVGRVPKELSAVIQKMMAKNPDERFADMGEVVRTLEGWLGVHRAGTFAPRDEQIEQIEACVKAFNLAPAGLVRRRVLDSAASVTVLVAVLLLFFGQIGWAIGLAAMILQGAASYFVLNGLTRQTFLFGRVRQFVRGFSAGDWMVAVAVAAMFAVLLAVLGLFLVWIGFGLVGTGLAFALHYGLDRRAQRQRRTPVGECDQLLRRLRLSGVNEAELRQFVAKYSGRDWEEFFEELFGYEAKLTARSMLSRGGYSGAREKYAAWRDPIAALLARVETSRQGARERELVEQLEMTRLLAEGLVEKAAGERAMARIGRAHAPRYIDPSRRTIGPGARTPVGLESLPPAPLARTRPATPLADRPADVFDRVLGSVLGVSVRLILVALLFACCTLWVVQNRLYESVIGPLQPLSLAGVPASWTQWCDSPNVGWAGVLLLVSLFFRGHRMAILVVLGSAVVVFGHHLGIRTVEPVRASHVAWLLGTAFALVGYRIGRR